MLLMCKPTYYDVNYVINPWMEGNLHKASKPRALAQWQSLHDELAKHAEVRLVTQQQGSPDMVFTANAGLAHGLSVALSRFQYAERQAEEDHFGRWFAEAGYDVFEMPREMPFEGEGDALFASDCSRLWAGYGFRTSMQSHDELRRRWDVPVHSLRLSDARFYHLDTCFAPLPNGDLMYFPQAFDAESRRLIEQFYAPEQRIIVAEADALRFACNVVCLRSKLVLNQIGQELRQQLQMRGFEVIELELDEFLKAGGAAKCLVMHLT